VDVDLVSREFRIRFAAKYAGPTENLEDTHAFCSSLILFQKIILRFVFHVSFNHRIVEFLRFFYLYFHARVLILQSLFACGRIVAH
jgi:hypothetical protein